MAQTATGGSDEQADSSPAQASGKVGIFAGLLLFVRQVVAELSKVVAPTRKQLLTYFVVVLFFVMFIMGYVFSIDLGFGALVDWLFGEKPE